MLKENSKSGMAVPRNLADQAYEILENAILNGEFSPGEEMPETAIAEKLGISATPVREAINRLAADGLVIKETNKRPRMIKLAEREVHDLYDVRAALESLSISTAALYATPDDIQELKKIQDTGEEYFNSGEFIAYRNYDRAFHDRILGISGNTLLIDFMKRIRTRITLCISSTVRIPELHEQGVKQHREMIDLLERKDAKGAEELMKNHLQIAKHAFLRNYRTQEMESTRNE